MESAVQAIALPSTDDPIPPISANLPKERGPRVSSVPENAPNAFIRECGTMLPCRTAWFVLGIGVAVSGCSAAQLAAEGAHLALTAISAATDEPHSATGRQYPKNPSFPVASPSPAASTQLAAPTKYCYDPGVDVAYQAGHACAAGDHEVTEREYQARKAVEAAGVIGGQEQPPTSAPARKPAATAQQAPAPQALPALQAQTAALPAAPAARPEIPPIPETMTPTA